MLMLCSDVTVVFNTSDVRFCVESRVPKSERWLTFLRLQLHTVRRDTVSRLRESITITYALESHFHTAHISGT